MNNLTSLIIQNSTCKDPLKTVKSSGEQCDHCRGYFDKLLLVFTNNIGFKELCDKCGKKNEFFYNKGLGKFPTNKEFANRRRVN